MGNDKLVNVRRFPVAVWVRFSLRRTEFNNILIAHLPEVMILWVLQAQRTNNYTLALVSS